MYRNLNEVAKKPNLWIPIAGFINPATAVPILAVGIFTYVAIKIFKKDKPLPTVDKELEAGNQPLNRGDLTPKSTVGCTVGQPLNVTVGNGSNTLEITDDEYFKEEMIRQTMSELGKRSARARARKGKDQ